MARYNKRNDKWQVIIELGRDERTNKRLRHTKDGFKTKKEAIAYATIKENELLNGLVPNNNKILLKDFITEWYEKHITKTMSINTISNYKSRIETHIIPYLGNMQLNKIKVTDVQSFYYYLIDNGLKSSTAKKVIETLTRCFKYALKMRLVSFIPCDIEYFKDDSENKIKAWNEDELSYFLNEIKDTYLYLPVLVASLTGLRIGELCGLRWENVDLDNNRLYIKEQVLNDKISKKLILTDILKTSKSNRVITIPDFLKNILQDHKPDYMINKVNDFVILSRNNTMCNPRNLSMDFTKNVAKYTKPIEELTNAPINYKQLLKLSFHDLRHTHATILLKHGENVKVISERLGHTSIKITLDTYSHVLPSMEEHTALLLNNIFKDKL